MPAFAAEQEGDRVAEIDWVAQSKEARHPRHQAIPSYLVNSSCQTQAIHPSGHLGSSGEPVAILAQALRRRQKARVNPLFCPEYRPSGAFFLPI